MFIVSLVPAFYHGTMDVGNDRLGVHNTLTDIRNDGVRVCEVMVDMGDNGLGVLDVLTNGGNRHICVDRKFGLEKDSYDRYRTQVMERTLKIWRILLRSNFQAAIVSLSLFEWKTRESRFRPLFSVIFF